MKKSENYLEKKPLRNPDLVWSADGEGIVTLEIENKGIFNRIAQKIFKKPKISYVHLDKNGSFVWQAIDGERNISDIAELVDSEFGEAAQPLYERLAKYFKILESYGFVKFK